MVQEDKLDPVAPVICQIYCKLPNAHLLLLW